MPGKAYAGLKKKGYDHEMTSVQKRRPKEVSALLPRVHLGVVSLLKRGGSPVRTRAECHTSICRTTSMSSRFVLTGENQEPRG